MIGFDRDHRPSKFDHGVAWGLAALYFVALMATLDIGYTRDEGFYFRYARVYQDWFTDVERDLDKEGPNLSLQRDAVVNAWTQNFEHPPLMKTLFGWSWRVFGRKLRIVQGFERDGDGWKAEVTGVGKSEGFDLGAEVDIRSPHVVDEAVSTPVLRGTIVARDARKATLRVENAGDLDLASFTDSCAAARKTPAGYIRGCTAEERDTWAWLSEGSAIRLPSVVFSSLLIALIYIFGVRLAGRWAAAFAAIAYAALPRAFFHAHLACFDVPVVLMTLLTLYTFWRAQWSRRWALLTGFVWGFALLTKHNAFFLPVFLVLYWLVAGRDQLGIVRAAWSRGPRWAMWVGAGVFAVALGIVLGKPGILIGVLCVPLFLGWRLRLPPLPLAFLLMPLVGLPVFFALWPKLWFDPANSLRHYFAFHLDHDHYVQYYFGNVLEVPPFPVAFPFVITALTVPVLTLVSFLVGSVALYGAPFRDAALRWKSWRENRAELSEGDRYRRRVRAFIAINLLLPIVLIALPSTPIFGGVKHWLTAMPFFAIVAGMGFDWLRRKVVTGLVGRSGSWTVAAGAALFAVFLLPSVVESARIHPYGTGYYNSLVGGVQGAADARLHRQFWGYATRQTLDRLNREAPPRARVYFQNTTRDAYVIYQRDGLLRKDIRYVGGSGNADIALLEHQKSFAGIERALWEDMGARGPAWQVVAEGVPMISVYVRERPKSTRGRKP